MPLTRRNMLVGCSAAIAALAGGRLNRLAFAAPSDSARRDILVVVSLRGGCDGLNLVGPVSDRDYAAARPPDLRVRDGGEQAGLHLDNGLSGAEFRLHPGASAIKELYDSQSLAIVHACGLTSGTRSHFEAMDYMERGTPDGSMNLASGWLSRYLATTQAQSLMPAMAVGSALPIALSGTAEAIAMGEPANFSLNGHWKYGEQQQNYLRQFYGGASRLHLAGQRTLHTLDTVQQHLPRNGDGSPRPYEPEEHADYPEEAGGELSRALKSVAQLIKMDVGLQVATVDYGGWDTHESQAYIFPTLVEGLGRAIQAFYNDLSRYHDRLTLVVLSEFGRRLKANESNGTDHGHGNVMLVLGGNINGGRMYGTWPGLANEQLDDGADLAITTDYRVVLAELLERRLATPNPRELFPSLKEYGPLGIAQG